MAFILDRLINRPSHGPIYQSYHASSLRGAKQNCDLKTTSIMLHGHFRFRGLIILVVQCDSIAAFQRKSGGIFCLPLNNHTEFASWKRLKP